MRKKLFNLLLCLSILLAGCAGRQANSTALKMQEDTTHTAELQNILRRAHQHKVISEDWGSLSWVASKPLGNAEGLTVGRATIKPGQTNPRHRHPKSEEVLLLLKGRINHTLDGKTITMSAGDVITIAPGVFHNASCIGSEDAEMVVVYSQGTRGFELE
jgi:quercetin dioxygenase-like cupin family protein